MSTMTDTFMTAAALAAVARGTTRLYNIANQRVKECNRLAAMVTELAKCGVTARELSDGIEIEGRAAAELRPASVACYSDHRIAMSFAVLGCRVPGIVITDKECTAKTYAEFWTDLETHFKIKLIAPDTASSLMSCTVVFLYRGMLSFECACLCVCVSVLCLVFVSVCLCLCSPCPSQRPSPPPRLAAAWC